MCIRDRSMTTWCSGTGKRWAERRTSLRGDFGAQIESAAVWVHLDRTTGRPSPWGDDFASTYLEATGARHIDARLRHDKELPDTENKPWQFRATDMDGFGHVNNAAYLAIAEEFLAIGEPLRIEIEWRGPSQADEALRVAHRADDGFDQLWVSSDDGDLRATITVAAL